MFSARMFFEKGLCLSEEHIITRLADESKIKMVKKGRLLVEEGEIQSLLFFMIEGVVRGYVIKADGQDITDCFVYKYRDVAVGINGLTGPSRINIETMSDCKLLVLPASLILSLMEESQEVLQLYNKLLLIGLDRHWQEKINLLSCSAMQRYLWFLENYPNLIDLVGNKYIASFLGMTPATLSRLRRRLREMEGFGIRELDRVKSIYF